MSWMTWVLFVGLLWIVPVSSKGKYFDIFKECFRKNKGHFIVADNFNGFIHAKNVIDQTEPSSEDNGDKKINGDNTIGPQVNQRYIVNLRCMLGKARANPQSKLNNEVKFLMHPLNCKGDLNLIICCACIIFLQKKKESTSTLWEDEKEFWPQMEKTNVSYTLRIRRKHISQKLCLKVLAGNRTKDKADLEGDIADPRCGNPRADVREERSLETNTVCEKANYDEKHHCVGRKKWYIINMTTTNITCLNCNNPVKKPEAEVKVDVVLRAEEGEVDAAQAANLMKSMADVSALIEASSAALTVGEEVSGILVKQDVPLDEVEEVSLAYDSPNDSVSILENKEDLVQFSRSITVSKEAFEKAVGLNVSVPFATLLRFSNLASDEMNSTVLGNEVVAVEMGAIITNLTNPFRLNFLNVKYEGIPSCHSWNGEGSRPNWTKDGCLTIKHENNISCECSHLTFFAILLTPLDETISNSDLKILTAITQAGCGLSMFFLSIVLFMHFLLRKTRASTTTTFFIHLVSALFLLNFTFLINNFVAGMKNSVGCIIMAFLMHYFMLATFTWFAVQAFHLCLQLYVGNKPVIRHYVLKVSFVSWIMPSIVGIALLITGKYGENTIKTDTEDTVAMCWITDNDVHSIVNIGYYMLVFLFTATTFIVIISWLFCLRIGRADPSKNGISIVSILGLCCMLGITWGFAFFAYGALRIPGYYIFTVFNSFQGFFLFIYYYKTSHSGEIISGVDGNKTSSSTLQTGLESITNPYNQPNKK